MPKRILIVDDYEDCRTMMKAFIEFYGYEAIEAADGYEALEKSIKYHPDLILMDLALPIMDGATATELIREIEGFDKVSIVALTGFSNTSFDKAIAAGFDNV